MSIKIIQIHNRYKLRAGEDRVFDATCELLSRKGNSVLKVTRDSQLLEKGLIGELHAFSTGIYSLSAYDSITSEIKQERPDVVHIHNLYPLFSPSVLVACRRVKVPVVMTCHNYRLLCPIGVCFHNGEICESCKGGREYWCVLKNCRENIFESFGYALRNTVARKLRLFHKNVTLFIALTEFAKRQLLAAGFKDNQIIVLPNMVTMVETPINPSQGQYVAFAGRMSGEKGVSTLITAARQLPNVSIHLAGDGPLLHELAKQAQPNTTFCGRLVDKELIAFYRNARFLVVPSEWFEVFGIVVLEAMSHGLPVIASKIGGLPEIVEDEVTGFLFEPGNAEDLTSKIKLLWENPNLCRQMGQAGREKAMREYSDEVYYERLIAVYRKAIEIGKRWD